MQAWFQYASTRFNQAVSDTWFWFDGLSREEWLIVLAACCGLGFLCMKSWGSRGPC